MYNNAPPDYDCPICLGINRVENEKTYLKQADLVLKEELVSVFINSFWVKGNEGHVIVVPNSHYENLFDLPDDVGARIVSMAKRMAVAMKKAYKCDGITLRQNNEPAGDQHAFHFHLHVFPRYVGDKFNENMSQKSLLSEPEERKVFCQKLAKELI